VVRQKNLVLACDCSEGDEYSYWLVNEDGGFIYSLDVNRTLSVGNEKSLYLQNPLEKNQAEWVIIETDGQEDQNSDPNQKTGHEKQSTQQEDPEQADFEDHYSKEKGLTDETKTEEQEPAAKDYSDRLNMDRVVEAWLLFPPPFYFSLPFTSLSPPFSLPSFLLRFLFNDMKPQKSFFYLLLFGFCFC